MPIKAKVKATAEEIKGFKLEEFIKEDQEVFVIDTNVIGEWFNVELINGMKINIPASFLELDYSSIPFLPIICKDIKKDETTRISFDDFMEKSKQINIMKSSKLEMLLRGRTLKNSSFEFKLRP